MKWLKFMGGFLIGVLLCCPLMLQAQQAVSEGEESRFFEELARGDALQEQYLRWTDEEDQQDYWNDQKSFEVDLKKYKYKTYLSYLKGKCEAYSSHQSECSVRCGHGSYYYLQAAFYGQFNTDDLTQQLSSVDDKTNTVKLGLVKNEDPH